MQSVFPEIIWRIPNDQNRIYLTFDDGPHPQVTPEVLDILAHYRAHATFFLLGEHIVHNEWILHRIREEGHGIGNHGFRHLSGWRTSRKDYLINADKGYEMSGSHLFRPPYGRIGLLQKKEIQRKYRIVMWDIMAQDYDPGVPENKTIRFILRNIRSGSVVVLHEQMPLKTKILNILPHLLHELNKKEYTFGVIGTNSCESLRNA